MFANTLSPGIWTSLGALFDRFVATPEDDGKPPSPEELKAERDYVQDMIARNPEAFTSDLDVLSMMHMFNRRF